MQNDSRQIEQQARELKPCPFCGVDAEVTPAGSYGCRACKFWLLTLSAWNRRALTPTGENAKHVEVLRGILDEYVTEEQRYGWTLERDALQAAMRALSAPDNAEAVIVYDDVDDLLANCHRLAREINDDESGDDYLNLSADLLALIEKARSPRTGLRAVPAARVCVSGEDLRLCERGAGRLKSVACEETLSEAAAIYRLVQAVKGEG